MVHERDVLICLLWKNLCCVSILYVASKLSLIQTPFCWLKSFYRFKNTAVMKKWTFVMSSIWHWRSGV